MHNKGAITLSPESKIVEKIFINKLFDVKIDSPTKELIYNHHLKLLISQHNTTRSFKRNES